MYIYDHIRDSAKVDQPFRKLGSAGLSCRLAATPRLSSLDDFSRFVPRYGQAPRDKKGTTHPA